MSHRLVLTVTDRHYDWLEEIKKDRGLKNTQQAVNSVLEKSYRSNKKPLRNAAGSKVKKRMRNFT